MSNSMFKRKLNSINYPDIDTFDVNDEMSFRNLISWLEDQKIRHYKIEDRQALRDVNSSNWNDAYLQYCRDISCPFFDSNDRLLVVDWCLTFSLRLEFEDNLEFYKTELATKLSNKSTNRKTNSLDNLDFESNEFKECITKLANHLKIPVHLDNLRTLKACQLYINNQLDNQDQSNDINQKNSIFKMDEISLGLNVKNKELSDALKLLRLLYINNLRELQTNINQILVQVQSLTADPKTDSRLSCVGR